MIDLANSKLGELNAVFQIGNMLNIAEIYKNIQFDGITCFGNTLVHLQNTNKIEEFFSTVFHKINQGGKFIFQILNYEFIVNENINALPLIDNNTISFKRNYEFTSSKKINFKTELYIKAENKTIKNEVELLPIQKDELIPLLNRTGFSNIEVYSSFGQISAEYFKKTIAWYENDGMNNFSKNTLDSNVVYATFVYSIDIDNDGDTDILSSSDSDSKLRLFENNQIVSIKTIESTTHVYDFNATDEDNDTLTYSISGLDSFLFEIDTITGELSFKVAPDYESPNDFNSDNTYELNVSVTDSKVTVTKEIKVKVNDIKYEDVNNLTLKNSSTDILQEENILLSIYEAQKNETLTLNPSEYTATILRGSEYASFVDGVLKAKAGNFAAEIDILFEFKDLKYIETFKIFGYSTTPTNSLSYIETSYESNPFEIIPGNTYQDSLTDTNGVLNKTRWFKFNVSETNIYKLFYKVNKDTLVEISGSTDITYNLYRGANKDFIGSRSFDASLDFTLDLILEANVDYYLEFKTQEELWKDDYLIGLVANASSEQFIYEKITLDSEGKASANIILPKYIAYDFSIVSVNEFNLKLNSSTFSGSKIDFSKRFKEGIYTLDFNGISGSEIFIYANYSSSDIELENNDNILHANTYNEVITSAAISNIDTDFYSFNANSSSISVKVTVDSNISNDEIFKVSLFDAGGGQLATKTNIATSLTKSLSFDFSNYSLFVKQGNYYAIKVQKYNASENSEIDYSFIINGAKKLLSTSELAYLALYEEYIKGTTLDENLNIVTTKSDDIGSLIILTGDSDNPNDSLYTASQKLSKTFYKQFSKRGFLNDDIYWINGNSEVDINDDGDIDSVVDSSVLSKVNFLNSIENEINSNKTGPLYIYIVDHGSNGSFLISHNDIDGDGSKEVLYALEIKSSLDNFITQTSRDVVVIIEACKSGSFIPVLTDNYTNSKIAVITSSESKKLSYIDTFGNISFTKFLSDSILSGKTLYNSYESAKIKLNNQGSVYSTQTPIMYIPTDELKNIRVGGSFAAASMDLSSIESYTIDGEDNSSISTIDLVNKNKIDIKAKVNSASGVSKVWATIITPNFVPPIIGDNTFETPNLDQYTIELTYNLSDKTYETSYTIPTSSTYSGDYDITIYIEDSDGLVSSVNKKILANGEEDYIPTTSSDISIPLTTNWNLISADILIQDINSNINILWQYDSNNNKWLAYSTNPTTQSQIESLTVIDTLSDISVNNGTWIFSNSDSNITIQENNQTQSYTYQNRWNLAGTNKSISTDIIQCSTKVNSIWKYENNKWHLNTNIDNNLNLETFNIVNSNIGFWVNCN